MSIGLVYVELKCIIASTSFTFDRIRQGALEGVGTSANRTPRRFPTSGDPFYAGPSSGDPFYAGPKDPRSSMRAENAAMEKNMIKLSQQKRNQFWQDNQRVASDR